MYSVHNLCMFRCLKIWSQSKMVDRKENIHIEKRYREIPRSHQQAADP